MRRRLPRTVPTNGVISFRDCCKRTSATRRSGATSPRSRVAPICSGDRRGIGALPLDRVPSDAGAVDAAEAQGQAQERSALVGDDRQLPVRARGSRHPRRRASGGGGRRRRHARARAGPGGSRAGAQGGSRPRLHEDGGYEKLMRTAVELRALASGMAQWRSEAQQLRSQVAVLLVAINAPALGGDMSFWRLGEELIRRADGTWELAGSKASPSARSISERCGPRSPSFSTNWSAPVGGSLRRASIRAAQGMQLAHARSDRSERTLRRPAAAGGYRDPGARRPDAGRRPSAPVAARVSRAAHRDAARSPGSPVRRGLPRDAEGRQAAMDWAAIRSGIAKGTRKAARGETRGLTA